MAKRRGNGEGSIYQRRDGRWVAEVAVALGKRRYIYGRTSAEARKKLTAALKALDDGLPFVASHRRTVSAYLNQWIAEVRPRLRPRTHERYEQLLRLHVLPHIGYRPLTEVQPGEIRVLYSLGRDRGLSEATLRQVHAVLRKAFSQAEKDGVVLRNVVRLVDAPRAGREEVRPLSSEHVRRLLDAARSDRLYALYVLAAHTGMRQGELLGLKWDALDMDRGTVEVRTNLQRTKAGLELGEPKSRRSRRRISINRTVVQALREHRIRQFEEELSSGPAWRDQRFVFSNEVGGPIEAQNFLRRSFHRVLALSGIPRCRFHDLRHTAISLLLANGVPITTVSEIAGHSRTSVTLDVYGHNMPGGHEQATEMMRKVLG